MTKTLLIMGHSNFEKSYFNKKLLDSVSSLPNIHVNILKENQPFDIKKEQELLINHDTIILQFPFYWYSVPPILKKWIDEVLLYGFAYGENGNALKDKKILFAFTTAGDTKAYSPSGYNQHPVKDFLLPLYQTFIFTQSKVLEPFITQGCVPNVITEEDFNKKISEYQALVSSL